jgi:ABC-type uncharacterized transport system auxiliary subunit
MKRPFLILVLLGLLSVSCTTLETKIYSLHIGDKPERLRTGEGQHIAFLSVKAPRHLEQPYIIFRSSPYELVPSQYAKWDASPAEMVQNMTSDFLIKSGIFKEVRSARHRKSDSGYIILINLKDFSRLDEPSASYGVVALDITTKDDSGRVLYSKEFVKKERLKDRTYTSLAMGLSVAVGSILRDMAAELDGVLRSLTR